jgi:glycosyltransferase involved in cell wall biosynthesis
MLTLARGFSRRGWAVDLVVVRAEGELLGDVPQEVRLIELRTKRVIYSVLALARYLNREQPWALLSTLHTANAVAVFAGRLARGRTGIAIRQANHFSRSFEDGPEESVPLLRSLIRWSYPYADAIIAVSRGVADDLAARIKLPYSKVHVVPNPILTTNIPELAARPLVDDWFKIGSPPVILGVGRLSHQKRFDVLIQAFVRVRERCEARLMILGEGEERGRLQSLIRELGLQEFVSLRGFVDNPFAYLARARVFVLSSDWEGLPGALIQALACGTSVVATDCDSGPREILQAGRFGRLVPVGDVGALGEAICAALREPRRLPVTDSDLPYSESASVDAYLAILRELRRG